MTDYTILIARSIASLSLLVLCSEAAEAAAISVPNFSFQEPDAVDGGSVAASNGGAQVSGWTYNQGTSIGGGVFNPQDAAYPGTTGSPGTLSSPAEGEQVLFINFQNSTANGSTGSFISTLPVATAVPELLYELTVAIGDRGDAAGPGAVDPNINPDLVIIELLLDGVTRAIASHDGPFGDGTFIDLAASFLAIDDDLGKDLQIRLTHTLNSAGGADSFTGFVQANFDNVRLTATPATTAVPEPSTALLLGLGMSMCAFGAYRKHERRRLNSHGATPYGSTE